MSQINWITPAGSIGKVAEEDYFEFQLDAYSTQGAQLTYTVISGKLASGLQLFRSGLIQGIPVIEYTTKQEEYLQTFTVRATNVQGKIADRTFSITINSIALPQIIPKNISLGTFYDGYFLNEQLVATDPHPVTPLIWKVIDGELPLGSTLTPSGLLSGFLEPDVSDTAKNKLGWSQAGWGTVPWDAATAQAQSRTYRFTVQVFDGARYDNSNYTITVRAKSLFTVDNSELLSDTDTISIDIDTHHAPFITTQPQSIPTQRQESNFAFKIDGRDLDGETIFYEILETNAAAFDQHPTENEPFLPIVGFDAAGMDQEDESLPPGVTIDHTTGWITGHLGPQVEETKTYKFGVYCYKVVTEQAWNPAISEWVPITTHYFSQIVSFTLTVLGDRNNTIEWLTPSDLGYLDNGSISEFSIVAVSKKGKTLNYRMQESNRNNNIVYPTGPGPEQINPATQSLSEVVLYTPVSTSRLPQGLTLTHSGLITGRATFEYFTLDSRTTTFDKNATNFDNEYQFTVTASDDTYDPDLTDEIFVNQLNNATVASSKTFVITMNNYNVKPYENIYLKALPSKEQRVKFSSVVNNLEIFPNELIYRADDLWFGKAKDIKFLFAAGLEPSLASTYIETMNDNHYTKRIELGNVKTAVALDENFNTKYEVIYVEVLDGLTENNKSISMSIDRTLQISPPYNTIPEYQIVYPNSLDNMETEVSEVGHSHKGALPKWMVDKQDDGRVLGFTRGVVLAYTIPGASKLIAYRLKQYNESFDKIDFVVDRYQLDHTLSKHFVIETQHFEASLETTFDRLVPSGELFPYAGSVNFAVTIPFDEINGRTLGYIHDAGGLDGSFNIQSGQTLIFAKQEGFESSIIFDFAYVREPYDTSGFDSVGLNQGYVPRQYTSANDGWNMESGLFGTNTYGELYALSEPVPTIQRHGIWEVNVSEEGLVTLLYVKDVLYNEHVHVIDGNSYRETKLYYDPIVHVGHTVPAYSILSDQINVADVVTRFDGNGTRFYNNRDEITAPEVGDVYLKFPKSTIYQ